MSRTKAEAIAAWAEDHATEKAALVQTSKYARLTVAEIWQAIRLAHEGVQQTEIARIIGCADSTISDTLKRAKADPDTVRAILASQSVDAAEQWTKAMREAAKRGDHRPARELIEAAHPSLKPATAGVAGGGGGVTIVIGTLDAPIRRPDIEVKAIDTFAQPDSLSPKLLNT